MSMPCAEVWAIIEKQWSQSMESLSTGIQEMKGGRKAREKEPVSQLGSVSNSSKGIRLTLSHERADAHIEQMQLKGTFLRIPWMRVQMVRDDYRQQAQLTGTLLFKVEVRYQLLLHPLTYETSSLQAEIDVTFPRGLKGWLIERLCRWGCKRYAKKPPQEALQEAVESMMQAVKQEFKSHDKQKDDVR